MIDLHSHILPGIDDGAKTMDDAIALIEQSIAADVTHIVCTPHIHQGVYDNDLSTILNAYDLLCYEVKSKALPIKLAYSGEVRICPEIVSWVANKQLPFLGSWEGRSVLLLELPHSHIPPGVENLIKWLLKSGIQPVIPHPERNRDIIADYRKATSLKKQGCLFQVTAGAFTNRFNERVRDLAVKMLSDGLIDYIASDMHSIHRRPNDMKAARVELDSLLSAEDVKRLTHTTPALITADLQWR